MTRFPTALLLLAAMFGLSACETSEQDVETAKKTETAAAIATPTTSDDKLWKPYLAQQIGKHMDVVSDRLFSYYLPADNATVEADGRTKYDRLSEGVTAAISRTVLPGNLLAFGSPDSKRMADMIVSAFSGAKPDALKGSHVLFIGKAEDSARIQPLVEASGAKYIFEEVK